MDLIYCVDFYIVSGRRRNVKKGNNLKKVIATIVMACLLLTMVGVSSKEIVPYWSSEENIEIL